MVVPQPYTVTSLFCGVGGLDLGFEYAGFRVIWANDISKNAVDSYAINFGIRPVCSDLAQLSTDEIPYADVIVGGPPCQSFSLVGKRRPGDERGQLVFLFLEVVRRKRPRAFVMENVPGLAASRVDGHRLTDVLADEFRRVGYNVDVVKLTATDYLVPQRRQRVFILGSQDGDVVVPDPRTFAEECYHINSDSFELSARAALGDLDSCVKRGEQARYRGGPHSDFARLMRRSGKETVSLHECPRMSDTDRELVRHIPPGGNYRDIPDELSLGRVHKFKQTGGRTTTYGRLHPDKPAYTINTYFRRPNVGCNFHYEEPRLISPREAMRLQALPDHFELCYNTQDERNSFIGNAVPPLLGHAIAWSLWNCFEGRITSTRGQGRLL